MEPVQDATVSNMDDLAFALTAYHPVLLSLSLEQGMGPQREKSPKTPSL